MKTLLLTLVLSFTLPALMEAQSLNQFRWKSRLVLLFTPSPSDPLFEQQVKLLYEKTDELEERNVVFMFITPDGKFENTGRFLREADAQKFYDKFNPRQYQFEMVLVGLDGYEKFRAVNRITPPSVLLNLIDGMPMRQREIIRGYGTKSTSGLLDTSPKNKRRDY